MIEQIPTFKGVKFSDKDLLDFGQCVKKNDRGQFVLLYGVDEVRHFYINNSGVLEWHDGFLKRCNQVVLFVLLGIASAYQRAAMITCFCFLCNF